MLGILGAVLAVALFGAVAVNGEHVFTMGQTIAAGKGTQCCLALQDFLDDELPPGGSFIIIVTTTLSLKHYRGNGTEKQVNIYSLESTNPNLHECWETQAPQTVQYYVDTYEARTEATVSFVDVDGNAVEEVFINGTGEVKVYKPQTTMLIQTDKPIYKPGQTVKFRVMTLDENFMALTDSYHQISIESPNGMRVAQWNTVSAPNGLVSLEMALSNDPILGSWTIKVESGSEKQETQQFKVDEYVLPKFEVTCHPPSYLLPTTSTINGKVCAKYTYGKPVKGKLEMTVSYGHQYYYNTENNRPTAQILEDIDGCYEFFIKADDIQLGNKSYSLWGQLKIEAKVTEDGTGIELTGESKGPTMSTNPLKILLEDDMDSFFKPGFPYKGRVIVKNPDDSPAVGEEIVVTGSVWGKGKKYEKTFHSDQNGIVNFVITDLDSDIGTLNLVASSTQYGSGREPDHFYYWRYSVYVGDASRTLQQWYSPSESYIFIPDTKDKLEASTEHTFDVFYTTDPNEEHEFYVTVMTGDKVLKMYATTHMYDGSLVDLNLLSVAPDQVLDKYIAPPTEAPPNDSSETPVFEEEIVPELYVPLGASDDRVKRGAVMPQKNVIAHFRLPIEITAEMSPNGRVLLYYMRSDGEIVAATTNFDVKNSFKNKADMTFSADTARPGEELTMNLKASPKSTCFVGMVDKSVNLLGGTGSMLGPDEVFNRVKTYGSRRFWYSTWQEDEDYCKSKREEESRDTDDFYYSSRPEGADASTAFREANILVLTDGVYMSRPCKENRRYYGMPGFSGMGLPMLMTVNRMSGPQGNIGKPIQEAVVLRSDSTESDSPEIQIRSHFPETWLWDMFMLGDDGTASIATTMPDTITEWVGNSLCTHPVEGLGVSPIIGVTAFQPFFVSLTLPYSAIRGETLPLKITVFNYLENCMTMEVNLKETEGVEIVAARGNSRQFCLCGGDSETTTFYIIPTIIGEVDIEATAMSLEGNGVCDNVVISEKGLGVTDGVQRQLLVEAEGVPQDMTSSTYVCLKGGEEVSEEQELLFPDDMVQGSERATVSVVGDIMGPTLSNLKNLLRMPYGCGEQNMASWSPNVYVAQYLQGTNQATEEILAEAKNYMRVGYQRQMNYRHSDNSYSAFGENQFNNATGSLWLTTFVVKTMAQSAPFVTIDPKDISNSVNWILEKQLPDGCFPQVGKVFSSYMKGGLADGENPAGLTAFVLIALQEARLDSQGDGIRKAFACLDSFDLSNLDTYTLAVMSYAYSLYSTDSQRRYDIMLLLDTMKQTDIPGQTYWKRQEEEERSMPSWFWYRASGAQVEMTAYVLLSKLSDANTNVADLQSIVQWLTRQRNPYGGFSSTQDTVIAIQALAKFAERTYTGSTYGITIEAGTTLSSNRFEVTNSNSLLFQSKLFDPRGGSLRTKFSGSGCVLFQVNLKYNIYKDLDVGPAFNVKVDVFRSSRAKRQCAQRSLRICTSYLKPGGISNMAIAEVKMLTGWEPVQDTLKELLSSGKIEKYEMDKGYVQIYFEELTKSQLCVDFEVEQTLEMNPKPAKVRVYDYYETDYTVTVPYEIKTTCGTKEEIPFDNEGLDCSIMQCRVDLTMPEEITTCPSCPSTLPEDSALEKIYCDSEVVYKTVVGRSGEYPIKIKANIRNKKKEILDEFVSVKMSETCKCPQLFPKKEAKVLIFTRSYVLNKKTEELVIGDETVVYKLTRNLESKVRKLSGRKKLCEKLARLRRKAAKKRERKELRA